MKRSAVTPGDLLASILSLPPIARRPDGGIDASESRKIVDWLAAGGVSTFMYGGVANFFNASLAEYSDVLDLIETITPEDSWVIPAIGPDFGKASDQVAMLRQRAFPTAILLPFTPVSATGVATGLRRLADSHGRPLMVFFKSPDYLTPEDVAALVKDGVLCTVEYGIARDARGEAPFLAKLLDLTGDASLVIDGAGERTIAGNAAFGLKSFTSGAGVIAPQLSTALFHCIKAGDIAGARNLAQHYDALEALRAAHGPVPVLHNAVQLADIAATGPIGPFFADVTDPAIVAALTTAATALKAASLAWRGQAAA